MTTFAQTIMFVTMIILVYLLEAVIFAETKIVEATTMFAAAMMFALLLKSAMFEAAASWRSRGNVCEGAVDGYAAKAIVVKAILGGEGYWLSSATAIGYRQQRLLAILGGKGYSWR